MSRHKYRNDGDEIVGEFLSCRWVWHLTVNHEFRVKRLENPFHDFDSESTKSVFMHDGNLCDQALTDLFQKGLISRSMVVKSTPDILDKLIRGADFTDVADLSLHIGRDSCIDAVLFLGFFFFLHAE